MKCLGVCACFFLLGPSLCFPSSLHKEEKVVFSDLWSLHLVKQAPSKVMNKISSPLMHLFRKLLAAFTFHYSQRTTEEMKQGVMSSVPIHLAFRSPKFSFCWL